PAAATAINGRAESITGLLPRRLNVAIRPCRSSDMHTTLFADLPDDELRGYLRAVHADPDGDAPRLALAEWLDGHRDVRGRMIRGSLGRLASWSESWEEDILAFWLGTEYPRGVRWNRVVRGLIRLTIDTLSDSPGELDEGAFVEAAARGWVGTVGV